MKNYNLKIKDLELNDRPREKLINQGLNSLSNPELLAIIFNTGNKKEGVISMTKRLINDYGEKSLLKEKKVNIIAQEFSLPINKACQLLACLEIGRRLFNDRENSLPILDSPKKVFNYLATMGSLKKEQLRGLYLNSRYQLIYDEVISLGTLNNNLIHPREVFKPAIHYQAAAIIIAHNHPSGNTKASQADLIITKKLKKAGQLLEIELLDHLIIANNQFISLI